MATLTIIFAKEPVPGQVKTRLTPPFSPQMACRLYHCFLEDTLEQVTRLPEIELALAYTPAAASDFFRRLTPAVRHLVPQAGPNLGERQSRALAWGFTAGFDTVLLRGSDTPDLPGEIILEAQEKLATEAAQVVLGPCRDGGYYLLGLKALYPELLAGLAWSTESVLAGMLDRARKLDLEVHLLPRWSDIDTYADLVNFLQRPHPPRRPGWRSDRAAREFLAAMDNQ